MHNRMITIYCRRLKYAHNNSKMRLFYHHLSAHRFNIIFFTFTPCQVYYFLKKLFIYFYCLNNKVLLYVYKGNPDKPSVTTINSMQRPLFASCLFLAEGLYYYWTTQLYCISNICFIILFHIKYTFFCSSQCWRKINWLLRKAQVIRNVSTAGGLIRIASAKRKKNQFYPLIIDRD